MAVEGREPGAEAVLSDEVAEGARAVDVEGVAVSEGITGTPGLAAVVVGLADEVGVGEGV